MKIIKRSGVEDIFDANKIVAAVQKANASVIDYEALTKRGRDPGYGREPADEQACIYRCA